MLGNILLDIVMPFVNAGVYFVCSVKEVVNAGEYFVG